MVMEHIRFPGPLVEPDPSRLSRLLMIGFYIDNIPFKSAEDEMKSESLIIETDDSDNQSPQVPH